MKLFLSYGPYGFQELDPALRYYSSRCCIPPSPSARPICFQTFQHRCGVTAAIRARNKPDPFYRRPISASLFSNSQTFQFRNT